MVTVNVKIWGINIGVVFWNPQKRYATFELLPDFYQNGLDLAPLTMPMDDIRRGQRIFEFPHLDNETYSGLPGMLSDSLPDAFGNQVIKAWLESQGRDAKSFSPVEKLSYISERGMGALEYYPTNYKPKTESKDIELESLISLVEKVLDYRRSFAVNLDEDEEQALAEMITIGTSAGGQRPKAIISYNRKTDEIRSGQVEVPEEFEYFILKFDGIKKGKLSDPAGYGKIEMVYHLMAKECGINMTYCDLLHENGRSHFITKRFDRKNGVKIHSQSLCAIAHYDYLQAGMHSYEGTLAEMREIGLPYSDFEQLFKRMVFNVVARNQDDHTKNISFLLEKGGEWSLGPAYDVCWSYNPKGDWTNKHQMTINGKRDNFTSIDILNFAEIQNIKKPKEIIEQVIDSVSKWPGLAREHEIESDRIEYIRKTHRLVL